MKNWDALNLFRAQTVSLSDWPTKPIDAILFHTRAKRDYDGLFAIAGYTLQIGLAQYIITNGSDGECHRGGPGTGWMGKKSWIKKLQRVDVNLKGILLSDPALDTREENTAFLRVAQEHSFKRAAILAQPHQILRAMLGLIQEMQNMKYRMQVYSMAPQSCPWQRKVYGSQGLNLLPRLAHINKEFEAIRKYADQGFLATPDEFFKYLKWRDK